MTTHSTRNPGEPVPPDAAGHVPDDAEDRVGAHRTRAVTAEIMAEDTELLARLSET